MFSALFRVLAGAFACLVLGMLIGVGCSMVYFRIKFGLVCFQLPDLLHRGGSTKRDPE